MFDLPHEGSCAFVTEESAECVGRTSVVGVGASDTGGELICLGSDSADGEEECCCAALVTVVPCKVHFDVATLTDIHCVDMVEVVTVVGVDTTNDTSVTEVDLCTVDAAAVIKVLTTSTYTCGMLKNT